jgi:hypothetical protein
MFSLIVINALGGIKMTLAKTESLGRLNFFLMIKSFLIWTFTLTVCLLVVGFPLIVLMVTIGSLAAIALQSVLPISAVALVAGGIVGANILAVVLGASVLSFKGIHPHEVSWLRWLNGQADPRHSAVYAACPLTCDLK